MKVLSINVNNFGGINPKPLPKDYKLSNGGNDWKAWEDAVDNWRDNNRDIIGKNVNAIADLAWDFDVAFFYEVETTVLQKDAVDAETAHQKVRRRYGDGQFLY